MKVLVTGASGNVGRYVVDELLKQGEHVVVAGTDVQKLSRIYGATVECVELDFTKPYTFENALIEIDRIFLMRPPQLCKPEDLYPFIQEVADKNIKLLVFLSLMGIENNPIPPHYKIEKNIKAKKIPYVYIRPGFFMQNISGIHSEEVKNNNQLMIPAGKSRTSFIDAKDIGLAIAILLLDPLRYQNSTYTLTGSEALNYFQIAELLSNLLKKKITYTKPSLLSYWRYYIKHRGLDKKYVNVTVALYIMTRLGTAKKITNDFYKLTGKQPRTFECFVQENKECFIK